jgi:hypothetical protein
MPTRTLENLKSDEGQWSENNALNNVQDIARTQMKDAEWSIEVLMGRGVEKDLRRAETMVGKDCEECGYLFQIGL